MTDVTWRRSVSVVHFSPFLTKKDGVLEECYEDVICGQHRIYQDGGTAALRATGVASDVTCKRCLKVLRARFGE